MVLFISFNSIIAVLHVLGMPKRALRRPRPRLYMGEIHRRHHLDDAVRQFYTSFLRCRWASYQFALSPEHVGKHFRVRVLLSVCGYAYTRVIGKIRTVTNAAASP